VTEDVLSNTKCDDEDRLEDNPTSDENDDTVDVFFKDGM
jgi:hypothetical protein